MYVHRVCMYIGHVWARERWASTLKSARNVQLNPSSVLDYKSDFYFRYPFERPQVLCTASPVQNLLNHR